MVWSNDCHLYLSRESWWARSPCSVEIEPGGNLQLELMGCLPEQPASRSLHGLRNDGPSSCGKPGVRASPLLGVRPTCFVTDGETEPQRREGSPSHRGRGAPGGERCSAVPSDSGVCLSGARWVWQEVSAWLRGAGQRACWSRCLLPVCRMQGLELGCGRCWEPALRQPCREPPIWPLQ